MLNGVSPHTDQADTLRQMALSLRERRRQPTVPATVVTGRGVRVMAVSSGKGGVGKSSVVVNLAIAMAQLGKRVLIVDADLGVGNIDVLLGLKPRHTLNQVLAGEKRMTDIIVPGPAGIRVIPAGSGVQEYTRLNRSDQIRLLEEMDLLEEQFDTVLVDTAAGISENVTYFNTAAQEIIVVASPEPSSLTDVYALIKVLATRYGERRFKVLVNMVAGSGDALEVFARLSNVTSRFLDISLDYLGCVHWDDRLVEAVRQQRAVIDRFPTAVSSRCFQNLARRLAEQSGEAPLKGNIQFFFRQRVAASGREYV